MYVDWNGELVEQLEVHWQQRLRPRLGGLMDDEYFCAEICLLRDLYLRIGS